MRSHGQIITEAGGPHAVARMVHRHVEADEVTVQKRVRAWAVTGSIPGEYWALLDRLAVAPVAELAAAAADRKGVSLQANDIGADEASDVEDPEARQRAA